MIALLLALTLAPPTPGALTVATARGDVRIPVTLDGSGAPVLAGSALARALGGDLQVARPWATLRVGPDQFRFLIGAPYLVYQGVVRPLAGPAVLSGDSLMIPFQFAVDLLPRIQAERFRYDPDQTRLVMRGGEPARLPNGLLPNHIVTVDAGHGGIDPGNPGLYFPRGVREKDVTLQVALLLRRELEERGVQVRMTRTRDTLIALRDRAATCTDACDLFISLHVDALDTHRRRDFRSVSGFSSWIIGEENTEDADRVARMENEALRFEGPETSGDADNALSFLLRDLQMNEILRESAQAAALIQEALDPVHSGTNRGIKQSNRLAVLNLARRPSVLVEMGYSTNVSDARIMSRRQSQESLAAALADAVVKYLLDYERKTGMAP